MENSIIIKLSPSETSDNSLNVSTFEQAFEGHSNARGKGKFKAALKKANPARAVTKVAKKASSKVAAKKPIKKTAPKPPVHDDVDDEKYGIPVDQEGMEEFTGGAKQHYNTSFQRKGNTRIVKIGTNGGITIIRKEY